MATDEGRTLCFMPQTILDCDVVEQGTGPWGVVFLYRVATNTYGTSSLTGVTDAGNAGVLAQIHWVDPPSLEMPGRLPRQEARHWLRRSDDYRSRVMTVNGVPYEWTPCHDHDICLYSTDAAPRRTLIRVTRRQEMVILWLSPEALGLRLLELAVVAVVLLLSGRNID